MSAAIVLPARMASTRLPNKLLLDRTGKTVLEHTLAQALAALEASRGLITSIRVACDDEKLAAVARKAGVDAVLTDPALPSGTDRIAAALDGLKEDLIINVQADEPELNPELIVQAAALLDSGPIDAEMSTLAVPIYDKALLDKPNVVKVVVDAQGRALYFSRAPIPFLRDPGSPPVWTRTTKDGQTRTVWGLHHVGLYGYKREFLLAYTKLPPSRLERIEKLEQLRAIENGHTILVGLAENHPPGIDTPEDYEAFVVRWDEFVKAAGNKSVDLQQFQSEWLDRGSTFYGH